MSKTLSLMASQALEYLDTKIMNQCCIDYALENTEENRKIVTEFQEWQAKRYGDEPSPLSITNRGTLIETNQGLLVWSLAKLAGLPMPE